MIVVNIWISSPIGENENIFVIKRLIRPYWAAHLLDQIGT